ncbi:hypothetical protein MN202_04215 [Rheinheimera muenzenbergensis]|uniref:Uncharacterized protein n=1 Tax=Rheinheimera muenzenbergensis TaxID=1193628 RepID=A0ABU8C3D0_9GAMM
MTANLAIFVIRSLISLLVGGAHLYFVILCFAYINSINPLPEWLSASANWRDSALLIMSVADLVLHLLLALPAAAALLYLQGEQRHYHLGLIVLPILVLGLHSLWRLVELRDELSLTYLSYINTLIPSVALAIVGLLAIKHFSHIKAHIASTPQ